MADSIPSLRRLVNELSAKLREAESKPLVVVQGDPVIQYVEKIVEKIVTVKELVPSPPIVKLVYVDNPDHIDTIRKLQEKICQFTSQSDLS